MSSHPEGKKTPVTRTALTLEKDERFSFIPAPELLGLRHVRTGMEKKEQNNEHGDAESGAPDAA